MIDTLPNLPIDVVLPEIKRSLARHNSVILAAEPGSGKTTIVPLALLGESWLKKQKIILLEPRRLATRMAARRMSDLAGDVPGGLVGYRIRFDSKISKNTQIEVVTEGIFLRMIQNDPELSGVGLIIFDEFHERSIQSDLALAFCLDSLELRDDLKIMIMSATIASERIAQLLGNARQSPERDAVFRLMYSISRGNRTIISFHRQYVPFSGQLRKMMEISWFFCRVLVRSERLKNR